MKKRLSTMLAVMILSIIECSYLFAQMPPNPRLLEQIRRGGKPEPYFMRNIEAVRNKGIDAPWSSTELNTQRMMKRTSRLFGSSAAPTGSWKALVILVQFSDKPKQVSGTYFDTLLFQNKPGTLRDYYKKVSYGYLDIVTVNLPSAIGWQNAPQTYSYYCNGQNGTGNYPQNSQKLTEDLVNMIDPVVDFSQYDNNGDGYVDALFIVHAGPGAEFTGNANDIWSHAWQTSYDMNVDGVKVSHYSIEPEYWQNPGDMTIGVFAHELGHAAFGLPDLYDRDYSSEGLGNWSLMAGGSWDGPAMRGDFPSMPDAWSRIQMGYASPIIVSTNLNGQEIRDVEDNSVIYKLWKNGEPGSQYFLVENRQQTSFDQYIPNSGLLIYHVDESVTTQNDNEWYPGHTSSGHYLVALEEADGFYNLERGNSRGDLGDSYPGSSNNTNFTSNSLPNSLDYNFNLTGAGIRNISPSAASMTADLEVSLTQATLVLTAPQGGQTLEAGQTFQIQWSYYLVNNLKIEYSTNNGTNWATVADNIPASSGNYNWTVPNTASTNCKVRISDESNAAVNSVNTQPFYIVNWDADYFVWEPNPMPSSGIAFANLLQGMGSTVAYSNSNLPSRTVKYKAVFVCLGVYPNNHRLTNTEAEYFVSYLKQGGNIYMEGGDTWAYDAPTPLHPLFNIAGLTDGDSSSSLSAITGVASTMMEGLSFNYNGGNSFIDHLAPLSSAFTIFKNNSPAFDCAVANSGSTYKSVGASFEFGGLVDAGASNTKQEVLTRILNFFNQTSKDPENLTANLNDLTGLVSLNWQASGVFPEIFEDFNDGVADNFNMQDNRFSVSQGYLKMTGIGGNNWASTYYNKDFTNFVCEYEFQRQDGDINTTIGAFIRSNGIIGTANSNGYLIAVTVSGAFSIWKEQNGSEINIVPWSGTNAINTGLGAPNIATITASGSNIKLYINGYFVAEFNDGTFPSGKIGLCTYDDSASNQLVWWDFFGVDENIQNIASRTYPKAVVSLAGIGTAAKGPLNILKSNSIPAVRLLMNTLDKNVNATFQYFNIYRNNNKIDTTSDTHYADRLTNYGTYGYKITAQYNDHESNPAGPVSIDYNKKLNLSFPTGGLTLKAGSIKKITWTSEAIDTIKIELSTDNGTNWTNVANSVYAIQGFYMWTVPATASNQCKIRISDAHNPDVNSTNQDQFSIILYGIITEIEPNNTLAQAMDVSYADADSVNASINPIGDIDYYKIQGNAGDTLMINSANRNGSSINAILGLLDQNGYYIYDNSNFLGDWQKQRIVWVLPYTGVYYVRYAYINNWNGIPSQEKLKFEQELRKNPNALKVPQQDYNQGDYRITFNYFKAASPIAVRASWGDLNYNSIRYWIDFVPNGLSTTVTIQYGLNTNYGSSIKVFSDVNGTNEWYNYSDKVTGLLPNTTYHFRMIVQNALGADTTLDNQFTTTQTPDGWIAQNSGTSGGPRAVDFIDSNNGCVAVFDNANLILVTTDGGNTWVNKCPQNQSPMFGGNGIQMISVDKIVVVGNGIMTTENGGSSWTYKQVGNYRFNSVSFTNKDTGIAVNDGGEIYKTIDGGNNWTLVNSGLVSWLGGVKMIDANNIIAAGNNGTVLKSNNGGSSWDAVQLDQNNNWLNSVSFADKNNGIIVGDNGADYKTTNGGSSWMQINSINGSMRSVSYITPTVAVVVGQQGYIYRTFDGGNSWSKQNSGTADNLWGVYFVNTSTGWVVGDWGIILKTTNYLRVVSPNGGEHLKIGTQKNITWSSNGVDNVKIEFSTDNGSTYNQITASTPASSGSFNWTVPNNLGSQNKIRITNTANASMYDESDASFSIVGSGPISETEPNNTLQQANTVSYTDTVNASINPIGDIDYYKISGAAGDTLVVYASDRNNSGLDGRVALLDQNGSWLIDNNSFNNDWTQERVVYFLPYTGIYYVRFAYEQNWNGVPAKVKEEYEQSLRKNPKALSGPQKDYNQGDYFITFNYFKPAAPLISGAGAMDYNYNSIRIYGSFFPNGLPTTATLEYGTTTSYGNSIVLATNVNSLNEWGTYTDKITGLQANTTYHFRMAVQNALGADTSWDNQFTTPLAPDGWTIQNSGTTSWLPAVDFIDVNNGVVVTQEQNKILVTTDGGTTWVNKCPANFSPTFGGGNGVDMITANRIVAVGSGIMITTDGGNSWAYKQVGNYWFNSVSFTNKDTGIAVNQGGEIYKTVDGGNNWTLVNNGLVTSLQGVKMIDANNIIAAGNNGTVLKSNNGGSSWDAVQLNQNNYWLHSVSFADQNNGMIVGDNGADYRTTNGGSNWSPMNGINGSMRSVSYITPTVAVAVGQQGWIYRTNDGGATWTNQNSGTANQLYGVSFISPSQGWIAGDWGTILKYQVPLLVTSPNGDEAWQTGSTHNITWNSNEINNVKLEYSINNQTRTTIAASVPASSKSYSWTVPNTPSNSAKIFISDVSNPSIIDSSDNVYTIYSPNATIVSIDTVGGAEGDSVTVPIMVNNFNNIGAITLRIHFNSAALQWGRVLNWNSQMLTDGVVYNVVGDTILISWASTTGMSLSSGKLADFIFYYKVSSAPASISFVKKYCEIADVSAVPLDVVYINGAVVQGLTISGQVTYDNSTNTPLPDIKVYLMGTKVDTARTDVSGNFIFNGVASGEYQFLLESNKSWEGVNSTDALKVKRYTVGLDSLAGLRLAAGDVNGGGVVNSTDALLIQRRTVGLIDNFTQGDWIFDSPSITLNGNSLVENIKGLTVGDVNGSYNPEIAKVAATINTEYGDTINVNPQSKMQIPITLSDSIRLGAITLFIKYSENLVDVEGVTCKAPGLLYNAKDGILSISWSDIEPLVLKTGEPLITINLKAKDEFKVGTKLSLDLKESSELADEEGNVLTNVQLKVPSVQVAVPKEYNVMQNYPNPFNPSTIIKYDLPEQAKVTIEIFNILGERVRILESSIKEAGSYTIEWNAGNVASGVYIYRFIAQGKKNYMQVKKMVLLK